MDLISERRLEDHTNFWNAEGATEQFDAEIFRGRGDGHQEESVFTIILCGYSYLLRGSGFRPKNPMPKFFQKSSRWIQ